MLSEYHEAITDVQLNLLDSHDTARFLYQAAGDRDALKLSLLFLLTMPGAPCLYYGTEIGMTGGPDPDCRRAFPWEESAWDQEVLDWTRRAIALRRAHSALRRGRFRRLYAYRGLYAFQRQSAEESVVVALNNRREAQPAGFRVDGALAEGAIEDLWDGRSCYVRNGTLNGLILPPRSAAVLAPRR